MSIYLYIKTHQTTGLKYFGKTVQDDPYKYKGSGTYWKSHLKKHGNLVDTEVLGYFTKDEVEPIALKFSKDNNIVESEEWANLIEENGLDGGAYGPISESTRKKLSAASKGKKRKCYNIDPLIEEERRKKISRGMQKYFSTERGKQQKIRTSTGRKLSQKSKDLISEKNGGDRNGMFGKKQSQEARDKKIKAQTGTRCYNNGLRNIRCRPENKPDGYVPGWLPRK